MRSGVVVLLSVVGLFTASTPTRGQADASPGPGLPKVVLVGDSIRLGYAPGSPSGLRARPSSSARRRMAATARTCSPTSTSGSLRQKPDVVHLNCGLHDLKRSKTDGHHQVELDRYAENLRRIVARIREGTDAALVFADTTPILDERHARRGADFDRTEADVRRYNAAAIAVMGELGVPVHDLHWVVEQGGPETMLGPDGTHYTAAGSDRLAEAVADCVLRQLTVRRYRPLPRPASGPEAAAEYRKAEARRDALVPEAYRRLKVGEFRIPDGRRRLEGAAAGGAPDRPRVARRPAAPARAPASPDHLPRAPPGLHAREGLDQQRRGRRGDGAAAGPGGPEGAGAGHPLAPLVDARQDAGDHPRDQRRRGAARRGLRAGGLRGALTRLLLARRPRRHRAVRAAAESGRAEQEDLFKLNLWLGRTLWGMFVRDDQVALDYLCSRPEVDASRIGATGMSMGSTRAWWLAAVDERVAAVVAVACLTRYQNLIAHGELRQHGVYYFVNGLLKHFDSEGVLALIAPGRSWR